MISRLQIRPAVGVKVRDPISLKHIPQEGCEVESSPYWIRRLNSGDVVAIPLEPIKEQSQELPLECAEILENEKPAKKSKSKSEELKV